MKRLCAVFAFAALFLSTFAGMAPKAFAIGNGIDSAECDMQDDVGEVCWQGIFGKCAMLAYTPHIKDYDASNRVMMYESLMSCDTDDKPRAIKLGPSRLIRYTCAYNPLGNRWECGDRTQVGEDKVAYCAWSGQPNHFTCKFNGVPTDRPYYAGMAPAYDVKDVPANCFAWQHVLYGSWKDDNYQVHTIQRAVTSAYLFGHDSNGVHCIGICPGSSLMQPGTENRERIANLEQRFGIKS